MKAGFAHFPTEYSIPPEDLGPALERHEVDSIWVAEHSHIPVSRKSPAPGGGELAREYYETYDPFVWLTMLAAHTTTVKLATGICLIIQRDPIHTAKSAASLDRLSGGRFLLGVGAGWNEDEMNNHGTSLDGRFKLMRERVAAIKAIWTMDEAEFHGDLVDFDPMISRPKPITKPHPPIHVGGVFPGGARRAVAWADGWIPVGGRGGPPLDESVREMREMAAEAGRDPSSIEVTVYRAPANVEGLQELAAAGVDRAAFTLPSVGTDEAIESIDAAMAAFEASGLRKETT